MNNASTAEPLGHWEFRTIASPVDSEAIRYGVYMPDAGVDRMVVFLNGRSEWIEKYDFLPEELGLAPRVGFVTMDHRGQGASGGLRAHVATYDYFAKDAAAVVADAVGDKPYVIIAHSMGGLISLYATVRHLLRPEALALSSPLFGLPSHPLPPRISKPVTTMLQLMGLGEKPTGASSHRNVNFADNTLTHDHAAFRRMQSSPYPIASPTFSWVAATFKACAKIFAADMLKTFSCPTLILGGSEEHVVDPLAFSLWVRSASHLTNRNVSFEMIPGARHELFNESIELRTAAIQKVRKFMMKEAPGWFR